jgi:hypothetical protein
MELLTNVSTFALPFGMGMSAMGLVILAYMINK